MAKWVCKGWYWVAKWVCKGFAWVVEKFCVLFGWILQLVCLAWDTLRCALLGFWHWLTSLFGRGGGKSGPQIEHVFVLMLENRSFDHMLGLSELTGVDIDGNPVAANGVAVNVNTNFDASTGTDVSVGSPAEYYLSDAEKGPGHEFENVLAQLCGTAYTPGAPYPAINNLGFIADYFAGDAPDPARIMRCYSREQLPVMNQLAREFAVCDSWFSSLPGPTFPNRFFAMAATSGGLDGSPSDPDTVIATGFEGYRFENGSIFDQLDQYCLPWRIYRGDDFPAAYLLSGMNLNELQGRLTGFENFESEVNDPGFDKKFVWIEPKYGADKFDITGPGSFTCGNSMHPLDDVRRGEKLIKNVYEVIRNSPHWENSVLIVTFDEHGGFYDHVAPPAATPPGDEFTEAYIQHHFQFDRYGVRVPTLVISPLIRKGLIDQTERDHTSTLATLQRLFGMGHLTARDAHAADLLPLFSLATPRTDAPLTLLPVADDLPPLPCGDEDDGSGVRLREELAELRAARVDGIYRRKQVREAPVDPSQIGFLQVALLRVLQDAPYPDRQQWIEDYRRIRNNLDAAIFMTEAKLKLRYGADVKREARLNSKRLARAQRHRSA
ncbi:alkaline phosphatase family protein [Rhodanobacter sp. L36]|uniref:alkaline phosphatase family protein n=1 Tax=Rhodanobacter sp. L36 TaxID=1747221 RepID=UPI00131C02E2|nr:alkaline phosphatase family protein [Rhodanobacter sp. L36]